MMPCYYDKILVDAFADGELSPEEAKQVEEHLTGCEECRQRVGAVKALSHVVGGVLRKEASPSAVKTALVQACLQEAGLKELKKTAPISKTVRTWKRLAWIGNAVAALLVVAIVCSLYLPTLSMQKMMVRKSPSAATAMPSTVAPAEDYVGTEQGGIGEGDVRLPTAVKGPSEVRAKTKAPQSGRYEESEKNRESDEYNAPMEQGQLLHGGIAPKPETPAPGPHGIGAPRKAPSRDYDYKADVGAVTTPTQTAADEPVRVGGGIRYAKRSGGGVAKTEEQSGAANQPVPKGPSLARSIPPRTEEPRKEAVDLLTRQQGQEMYEPKPAPSTPPVSQPTTTTGYRGKAGPGATPAPPMGSKSPQTEVAGKTSKTESDRASKLVGVAKGQIDKKDYSGALRAAKEALKVDPTNPEAKKIADSLRPMVGFTNERSAKDLGRLDQGEKQKLDEYLTEVTIPHSKSIVYPEEWDKIAKREKAESGQNVNAEARNFKDARESAMLDTTVESRGGKLIVMQVDGAKLNRQETLVDGLNDNAVVPSYTGDMEYEEYSNRQVAAGLGRRISFEFVETPLSEALVYIRKMGGFAMEVDREALAQAGDPQITLRVQEMPAGLALQWVLRLAGLDYVVRKPGVVTVPSTYLPHNPRVHATMKMFGLIPEEETGGAVKESRKEEAQQFVVLTAEEAAVQEQEAARALEPAQPEQVEPTKEEPAAIETTQGAVFKEVPVNPFVLTENDKFSTFAIDVDTASYALSSRYIKGGYLLPRGAVRMEEFVNAFDYNYPRQPQNVFNVYTEAMPSPFGEGLVLLKVGIMGKVVGREARKPANIVFVIDASGSMDRPDRLPLVGPVAARPGFVQMNGYSGRGFMQAPYVAELLARLSPGSSPGSVAPATSSPRSVWLNHPSIGR